MGQPPKRRRIFESSEEDLKQNIEAQKAEIDRDNLTPLSKTPKCISNILVLQVNRCL